MTASPDAPMRCDAPEPVALCPAYRADWRWGEVDRCDSWEGFRVQAMRDLGVTEWTPDVDPAAEVLFVRWLCAQPTCGAGRGLR